jgi:hypothetical protein
VGKYSEVLAQIPYNHCSSQAIDHGYHAASFGRLELDQGQLIGRQDFDQALSVAGVRSDCDDGPAAGPVDQQRSAHGLPRFHAIADYLPDPRHLCDFRVIADHPANPQPLATDLLGSDLAGLELGGRNHLLAQRYAEGQKEERIYDPAFAGGHGMVLLAGEIAQNADFRSLLVSMSRLKWQKHGCVEPTADATIPARTGGKQGEHVAQSE